MGVLKDYFLNSSLHGLHFVADARFHWMERFFWILCVLGSWGAAFVLMFSAIDQYQTQKISFTVDTSYLHWKTNFPAIVFCEKFNEKKMEELNREIFGITVEHMPRLENFVFYDGTMRYKEACQVGGALRHKCLLGNYSIYMNRFRSICPDVFSSCYYNGVEISCCEDFARIGTYHGPCFAFNSHLSEKFLKGKQYVYTIDRNSDYSYGNLSIELFQTGFYVYGLSQDAVPTKDNSKEYELIESATKVLLPNTFYKTFLSTQETFTDENARIMSVRNRGCRFYDENNLQHSNIYSTSACENECLVNAQMEICNCTVHTLPHNDKVKECDFDSLLCVLDSKEIAQRSKSCKCISSCFEMKINNLGFTKTRILNNQFRDEQSVTRLDIIVQPPTIRYTRSVVKNPLTMLVSVGGTAGLFLGASLLTIVEIIYYIIIRPLGDKYLEEKKNKRIKKSKQQQMDFFDGYYFEYVN